MAASLEHLSPGIRQVILACEADDLSALSPAFGEEGLAILRRWWLGEELAVARIVGDIWSPAGALGEQTILRQAGCAEIRAEHDVLDVACGIGGPGRILARRFGCRVHGLDISPDNVVVAQCLSRLEGLGGLTTYQVGDRSALPIEDESHDIVWGHGGWGFDRDLQATWREAFRVLRPGGHVCCNGMRREELKRIAKLGFASMEFHEYYAQVRRTSLELFLRALDEQKQQIVEQAGAETWDMFYDQKRRQLGELDGQDLGVVVATK